MLVQGYNLVIPLPAGVGLTYERYLGLLVTTGGATTTAGSINAFLTRDPKKWVAYADATN